MQHTDKYLRKAKAEFLNQVYATFSSNTMPLECTTYSNATIDAQKHGVESHTASDCQRVEARVLYAGRLNLHWGHFLTDSLPQLWPAIDRAEDFDKIIFSVDSPINLRNYTNIYRALELTGLVDKIELINENRSYSEIIEYQTAIYPRSHAAKEALIVFDRIMRSVVNDVTSGKTTRKIFLSRSHLAKAQSNEPCSQWLDDFFIRNGFEIVHPQELSLDDLIVMLHQSEVVAALQGSLTHNLLFAPCGTKLWIIEKYATANNYQPGIDLLRNLEVTRIDANAMIWPVSAGLGPFIVFPTPELLKFATDNNLTPPRPWDNADMRKAFKIYKKIYLHHYGLGFNPEPWEADESQAMEQARNCTLSLYPEVIPTSGPDYLLARLSGRRILKCLYHSLCRKKIKSHT